MTLPLSLSVRDDPMRVFERLREEQRHIGVDLGPVIGDWQIRSHPYRTPPKPQGFDWKRAWITAGIFALMAFALLIAFGAIGWVSGLARAQSNHLLHHNVYKNWINNEDKGCCNDQDCGELAADDERTTSSGQIEVRVRGEWCPVLQRHYLKRGNAPNWSTSHVCVSVSVQGDKSTCERLLCYQPKPGI